MAKREFLVLIYLLILLGMHPAVGQIFSNDQNWIDQLNLQGGLPEKLLATRSMVFYDHTLTEKDLKDAQEYFQKSGIDAVGYFALDELMAGKDITQAFSNYFIKREVTNLVFLEKGDDNYRISITVFNGKENVLDPNQNTWSAQHKVLTEVLKNLYRTVSNQLKRQNLLINDNPEFGLAVDPITGKRNEFFAIDVKVDPLAVPKFGNEIMDQQLEEIFKTNYPLKYKLTEPGVSEKELRKQGYFYVVCIVNARGSIIKDLLGYDMSKSESALVSVTYPESTPQLKNIPSDAPVYKIYLKHIDSGNVFLGTKWDADLTWEQALLNHIRGLKAELRIQ